MANRVVGTKQSKEYIKKLIVQEAKRQGVDPALALAVAQHESGFNNIAVSPKNTNGSRDHGVFQLNDKYHHLKNVYDPIENIAYGIKHLKGLLAGAKGNVAKALSDYNAGAGAKGKGRAQGDAYAKKVMNLMPQYGANSINQIAQSSPQPTAQINKQGELVGDTSSLEGGKIKMNNVPTGASADMGIRYIDPVTGEIKNISLADMYQAATKQASTPADIARNAQQNFLNTLDDPRVQALMNKRVGITPDEANQIAQNQFQMVQQMKGQNTANVGAYQQMLQDLYNRQNEVIMSDPRLQNQGFYVDPNDVISNQRAQLANQAGGYGMNLPTAEALAAQRAQANVANQYGIPYETLMAANQDRIKNQLAALQAQGTSLDALIKAAQTGDQNAINQLQYVFKTPQELMKESIGKEADYQKEVASQVLQGLRDPNAPAVNAYSAQTTQGMGNAADAVKAVLQGEYGLNEAQIKAITDRYGIDVGAQTQRRGQDMTRQTELDVTNIQQPAKNVTAAGSFLGNTSQVMGYEPEQQTGMILNLPSAQQGIIRNLKNPTEQYVQQVNPQPAPTPKMDWGAYLDKVWRNQQ